MITQPQVAWIRNAAMQAAQSFSEQFGRAPTQEEVTRIVSLLTRYVQAPGAPSFEIQ